MKDFNAHMGGVDKSDQLTSKYNSLRKTNKWRKTLFYHFLDIARVNAFILFENFRKKHRYVPELQRPNRYGQLDFTEELIRQLQISMYMLMFLLLQRNVYLQLTLLSLLRLKKEEIAKNNTKRNRKSRKLVLNVWAVKLTCVFRKIETVCSVFMSVSVIVCCAVFSMVAILEQYEICL